MIKYIEKYSKDSLGFEVNVFDKRKLCDIEYLMDKYKNDEDFCERLKKLIETILDRNKGKGKNDKEINKVEDNMNRISSLEKKVEEFELRLRTIATLLVDLYNDLYS